MGLFDFLFKKENSKQNRNEKKTEIKRDQREERQRKNISIENDLRQVIANKVEVTSENIDAICQNFVAFDTETTGKYYEYDVIIEVGAVRFIDKRVAGSYSSLINEGKSVPKAASEVNHITTEMLKTNGKKPEVAYQELTDFLDDVLQGRTFLCAYNASFDMSFLCKALERYGYSGTIKYVDVFSFSKKLVKGLPDYKQTAVAQHFNVINREEHRAVSDAEACGEIFIRLLGLKKDEIEKARLKELKQIPTDEEKEIIAIIANAMWKNGIRFQNLGIYHNTSNYVLMREEHTIIKFRRIKNKSYVLIPKAHAVGLDNIEECNVSEGEDDVRLLFDDPFELDKYGAMFSHIYREKTDPSYGFDENPYTKRFFEKTKVTSFSDAEIKEYFERAKKRKQLND